MTNKKRMAIATLCLSMGMGMAVVGTPALFAQQTDDGGQARLPMISGSVKRRDELGECGGR